MNIGLIKELFFPQHRVKKKINKYIEKKQNTKWKKYYYTYVRDRIAVKYGIEIGVGTVIEGPIEFPHPRNIVIGEGVKIGVKCTIFNNVTIGQKFNNYPIIGNNVTIYPGTVIIGGIIIGDNVTIGANSLVNKDVKANIIVAGNPAREIRQR